jgi:hypothetical protein
MPQRSTIPASVRLLEKIPFVLGLSLMISGLWLLLCLHAMTCTGHSVLDGWQLLRAASSGELLLVTLGLLGLIIIGFFVAHIRPGVSPGTLKSACKAIRVKVSAASLQGFRFTLRQAMLWVLIAAIASLIVSEMGEPILPQNQTVDILVGLAVSAAFGVGAVRHPVIFLAILLLVWNCAPAIDHPSVNAATLSIGGSCIAWLIGAPAGYYSRRLKRRGNSRQLRQDRPPREQVRLGGEPIKLSG